MAYRFKKLSEVERSDAAQRQDDVIIIENNDVRKSNIAEVLGMRRFNDDPIAVTDSSIYSMKADGTDNSSGWKEIFPAAAGKTYLASGRKYGGAPLYICRSGERIIEVDTLLNDYYVDYEFIAPEETDNIVVNGTGAAAISLKEKVEVLPSTDDEIRNLADERIELTAKEPIDLGDLFNLKSIYVDSFTRTEDEPGFITENHPYIKVGDHPNTAPIIVNGQAITESTAHGNEAFVRRFDKFPLIFSASPVSDAYLNICLYSDNSTAINNIIQLRHGSSRRLVVYKENDSASSVSVGSLFNSEWFLFVVDRDGVTIYNDVSESIFIPIPYQAGMPMTFGLQYGYLNIKCGASSFIQWEYSKPIYHNIDKSIEKGYDIVRRQRGSYTNPLNPGETIYMDEDVKLVDLADANLPELVRNHTTNKCYRCHNHYTEDDPNYGAHKWYRSECYMNPFVITPFIFEKEECQRYAFSADYFIEQSKNQVDDYNTDYIFQIHNTYFVLAQDAQGNRWLDPPPVNIHVIKGRLVGEICYISSGAVPSPTAEVTRKTFELGAVPYDEWFNIEVILKSGFKTGMMQQLIIKINGNEKVNTTLPNAFNIFSPEANVDNIDADFEREELKTATQIVKFGVYTPNWVDPLDQSIYKERTVYISNIKYRS